MRFLDTILFAFGLCASSATAAAASYSTYDTYLLPRLDPSLSIGNAYAAGLRDAIRSRDTFEDTTDLYTRSDLFDSDDNDSYSYSLYTRSALAEASASAWKDVATSLASQLLLERRGGGGSSSSNGGSRPGTPTGTPAYTRMIGIKHDMVPGHRYVFKAVQPPKDSSPFGKEMQQYCARKGYNHQFLIVGEVTASKDFVAKWWDLRKDGDKATSSASEKFDASRGTSLQISYAGTTTKTDASVSAFGSAVNKANGKAWVGDHYDCKSYVDQLAVKIVGQ